MILDNRCHLLHARRISGIIHWIVISGLLKRTCSKINFAMLHREKKLGEISRLREIGIVGQYPNILYRVVFFPFFSGNALNFIDRVRVFSIGVSSFSPREISINGNCNQI